ncbi:hemerythrin domain-containing protein [Aliiroseovarius sp. F47248L]|uniref:hemerythrin domain-containing protein n=1 Tax=Aliiroseovarius sp. F47248L TaxID=2926420 RepID=UPI001FF51448|nr:hemerythrin domain-containing protein [Aliiroseovarius sp. F47248L]MCK0139264.1 hemerythrin domain-containing protein [Aliiroseovarius sp. F47248L]
MTNIYDAIKNDHDKHREMLTKIKNSNTHDRGKLWRAFYEDVKSHAAAEEETFYSKLISKTWGQDAARHSVHEHQQLDDLMEEINALKLTSDMWMKTFEQLAHDYNHHMDEEENEVFERAKETINEKEIEGFGARFEARKKKERELIDDKREDSLED